MIVVGLAQPLRTVADQITLIGLTNTVWRYNDATNDLGTDWRAVNYLQETNSDWKNGRGLFGLDTTDRIPPLYPAPFVTPLVMGAGHITYYFRTRFFLPQNPASNIVEVTAYVDDGAVFYVNGVEVSRVRLPTNPVLNGTRAQLADPEGVPVTFVIDPSKLLLGSNTMAVELHQQNENSADVVFGLQMLATGTAAPEILDPTEPADRTVSQGEVTTFSVVGSGIPAPTYRWYHNNMLVPGDNGSTLTVVAGSAADAGDYFAVLSNSLGTAMSRVALLAITLDTNPPSVLYAVARSDLQNFVLPFTEPLEPNAATDTFNWQIFATDGSDQPDGLPISGAVLTDATNLTLTTVFPRDPTRSYTVMNTFGIPALFGPDFPVNTVIPVAIFPVELISSTNSWRYEHSGTDLGANWFTAPFDDSAWSSGPAPLDAFRAEPTTAEPHCRQDGNLPLAGPVGTCLMTLSNAANTAQYTTAYFRTRFNFSGDAAHSVLSIVPIVDDGAVFYLNGQELFRIGIPDGPVTYSTLTDRTVGNAAPEFREVGPRGLVQGENVLAVEVHQDSPFSADLTFGVTITAFVPSVAVAPALTSSIAGGNITISWSPPAGRLQSAVEIAGPWDDVADPSNPHSEPATGARKFYRVVVP